MYNISNFYKRAAILAASLTFVTLLGGYVCFEHTFLVDELLPASKSVIPWTIVASSDSEKTGQSEIQVHDAEHSLDYTFFLSDSIEYGYASVAMRFNSENHPNGFADLSKYLRARFRVKCSPVNTLSFTTFTFDDEITDIKNPDTYRIATAFFSCNEDWGIVEIDLQHMELPEWWLNLHKISLSDREYQLSHTSRFSFGVSLRSPKNVMSSVKITDVELIWRDMRFVYALAAVTLTLWLAFGVWLFKHHTRLLTATLERKIQQNKQLLDYQRLSLEPHRNKEKNAVLHFIATEYANPETSLESTTSATGIGKAKMNSILKEETGLTFTAYLNKLRLTEAARLLSEKPELNVSVIALSVGYNNVSYFNRLFKREYGSSPQTFRSAYTSISKSEEFASPDGIADEEKNTPDKA